jgi:uncharacterized surface protein with fasciclin (FAS1) repeats
MPSLPRASAITAVLLSALFALTACSGDSGLLPAGVIAGASAVGEIDSSAASTDLVGKGCAAYAKAVPAGSGSIVGMAQDPVAVAASNNPLLTTLVAAVTGKLNRKVNLVDALDSTQLTVFAPVDSAFAKLPKSTVAALAKPENAALLTKILTYHVVAGQLLPADVAGKRTTLEGGTLVIKRSGKHLTVNGATVVCGGVHTANATVYLIDTVLSPK